MSTTEVASNTTEVLLLDGALAGKRVTSPAWTGVPPIIITQAAPGIPLLRYFRVGHRGSDRTWVYRCTGEFPED